MTTFTPGIDALLREFHVLSLSVCADGQHWAAPLFYVLDPAQPRLLFVTDPQTRHGQLLRQAGSAVVTISSASRSIAEIRGLQMEGAVQRLAGADSEAASAFYAQTFPVPAHLQPAFWSFQPHAIKATDNRLHFGAKAYWPAPADAAPPLG
ncbi:pyridoxamine 5'-phosphate oxidase family protein [Comamonas sp. JUb58]|uniref:pyridoxamine 5'-phosphate oxidase family protein n=1 Tax=Comamonas sp. JUb58 TaxID=2485114 RepID=UPI00105DA0EE|nr:pyridoxamine 5'-phosphate oxidase family protein [Comamonas sp. JUb58]